MSDTIHKVEVDYGDRIGIEGYCTGEVEDIKLYYKDHKGYRLNIEPITVINITPEIVKEKNDLIDERERIISRLREIEGIL